MQTHHCSCQMIICKQWNFLPDSLEKFSLLNSRSNRQKPQLEVAGFVETVWLKEFLPWQAVTAYCPLRSAVCWIPLWAEGSLKHVHRGKGREGERPVFKESILIQLEHGYAIIWLDTADNLASCRSNNKSRHGEGSKGDRNSWNQHCHLSPSFKNGSITFTLQGYSKEWMAKRKSNCMAQQKIFLPLKVKRKEIREG